MEINPNDTVLTLTSGGCNALNLLVQGAGHVRKRVMCDDELARAGGFLNSSVPCVRWLDVRKGR
jgi:hypothetical protein